MKYPFRFRPSFVGAIAVAAAFGAYTVGCGGSTSSSSPEDGGGADGTTESGDDGSGQVDGSPDAPRAETSFSSDGGADSDATISTDTGADTQVPGDGEAGSVVDASDAEAASTDADAAPSDASTGSDGDAVASEAAVDASGGEDADAGPADSAPSPDADAGASDAAVDADGGVALNAQTFPSLVASGLCNMIASCCGTSGDAATFNWPSCYANMVGGGFKGSSVGSNLVAGGHVNFNAAQAQVCLDTIAAADCVSNQITAAEQVQLYQSCYAAYAGALAIGDPCAGTIECAAGSFCLPVEGGVGDAGAIGTCSGLSGVGGACGMFGSNQGAGQTACSSRGSGSDGLFCQNITGDAGFAQTSPSTWTCQPQWPNGSECYDNRDCSSMICHQVSGSSAFQCGSAGNWANASTCTQYVVDAGGGD